MTKIYFLLFTITWQMYIFPSLVEFLKKEKYISLYMTNYFIKVTTECKAGAGAKYGQKS